MRTFLITLAGLSMLAGPVLAQTTDAPLTTATNAEEGEYLVDASGMALYIFKADTRGVEGTPAASACEGDCLGVWPPLIVVDEPVGDAKVRAELLGTITRSDGLLQVTITVGRSTTMRRISRLVTSMATTSKASARIGT